DVDIYPENRSVSIRGRYTLENKSGAPIDRLHLYLNPDVTIRSLTPDHGRLDMEDRDLGWRTYHLEPPLAPGERMLVNYDLSLESRGFVNHGSHTEIVRNGTFFDNIAFFPHVGYDKRAELDDPNERRRRGLPPI